MSARPAGLLPGDAPLPGAPASDAGPLDNASPAAGTDALHAALQIPLFAQERSVQYILLVEDSPDDALLVQDELRKLNRQLQFLRVDCQADMREALAQQKWDLVITDHVMPDFDSLQAVDELRRSGQDAPLIIFSGHLPEHTGAVAMLTGACDFIDKAHRARLLPVVERELRNAGIRRAKDAVEHTLVHMTYHDTLTGLPNRAMLERLVEHHLSTGSAITLRSALLVFHLDRFLRVKEALGPDGGDEILRQLAARLAQTGSVGGVIARIGPESFAVYADMAPDALAKQVQTLFEKPYTVGGDSLFIHASLGVCVYPDGAATAGELISNAEHAQFDAKELGPGNVVMYTRPAGPADLFNDPLRLESALREGIERGELFLQYQPLVDVASGHMVGTEALVRWRHPRVGVVSAKAFVPLAEETGLIGALGAWVLTEACRQTRAWQASGLHQLAVAVNVSASQFRAPGFVDSVAATLAATGLDPHFLELELIESELIENIETTLPMLNRLKAMGVRLSIDDFGTGYSSLSYLSRLPIDVLKIDRSFLSGVDVEGESRAIASTIVALGKCLRLSIVAEGVETAGQMAFVRELACDRVQGYLIARPLDAEALARFAGCAPDLPRTAAAA